MLPALECLVPSPPRTKRGAHRRAIIGLAPLLLRKPA